MSRYIVEKTRPKHTYLAYLSAFLLVFNVYHSRLMMIFSLYSSTSTMIIQGLAVAMLIAYLMLDKNIRIRDIRIQLFDILLMVSLALIIFTTKDFAYNMTYIVRYAVLILIVILMKYDESLMEVFIRCIFIAGMIHVIVTFWFYFDQTFYLNNILPTFEKNQQTHLYAQVKYNGFATGLANHYSMNGIYISTALCCIYAMFFGGLSKRKTELGEKKNMPVHVLMIILFAITMLALVMTGKRGVLIFIIFAMIATYCICNRSSAIGKISLLILVSASIALLLYIMSFYIEGVLAAMERVLSTFFPKESTDISSGRFDLYALAWQLFEKNPVFGIGWREFTNVAVVVQHGNAELLDTHNVFLQLLCETGVVGFTVFMIVFITGFVFTLIYAVKSKRDKSFVPENIRYVIVFSLCYQIFFFGYCITGNPLYDVLTLYLYMLSIGMIGTVYFKYGRKQKSAASKYIIE